MSLDGSRLVATVAAPDAERSAYTSSLWEIDPAGAADPIRLTFSSEGETGAAFLPDGALLFTSERPDPQDSDAEGRALWSLPPTGEASVLARTSGGLSDPVVDPSAPVVVISGSRLADAGDDPADDEKARRKQRKESKASGILPDGMPVRYWDNELGETGPRVFVLDAGGEGTLRDLAPDAGHALQGTDVTVGGGRALCTWTSREPRGLTRTDVVAIDLASGARTVLLSEPDTDFAGPLLDQTGSAYAVVRRTRGTFETPHTEVVQIHGADGRSRPGWATCTPPTTSGPPTGRSSSSPGTCTEPAAYWRWIPPPVTSCDGSPPTRPTPTCCRHRTADRCSPCARRSTARRCRSASTLPPPTSSRFSCGHPATSGRCRGA
ncbi:MAG: hypothetical protein M3513_18145 [Actinomycetota bacterium]|nr:hypothetical protein [Actinomycetota bacterium]